MALTKITTHADDAIKRLPQAFKGKTRIEALLRACVAPAQDLENALWQLFEERTIESAIGAQLDVIGRIVGQPRDNSIDDQYRLRLRARVRANKSSGTVSEILDVFNALLEQYTGLRVEQLFPAAFILHLEDIPVSAADAALFADFLGDSKADGVGAQLHTSTVAEALTLSCPPSAITTAAFNGSPYGTSIKVGSTKGFPDSGEIFFERSADGFVKRFSYASKTATTFEQVTEKEGTAANFGSGSLVCLYPKPYDELANDFSTPYPATLELQDASDFPTSGYIVLGYRTNKQIILSYAGKSGNNLTGVNLEIGGAANNYAPGELAFAPTRCLNVESLGDLGGKLSSVIQA